MSREWENRIERLIEALRLAASEYDVQISVLPDFVHKTDEIALTYGEIYDHVPELSRRGFISKDQLADLDRLYAIIHRMSDDHSLWSLEALKTAPEWKLVRDLATSILRSLGKSVDRPKLGWIEYIPGKQSPD